MFTEEQKIEIAIMIEDAVNKAVAGVAPMIKLKGNPDYKLPTEIGLLDVVSLEPTPENPFHTGKYTCQGHQAQMHIKKGIAKSESIEVIKRYIPKPMGRVMGKVEKS